MNHAVTKVEFNKVLLNENKTLINILINSSDVRRVIQQKGTVDLLVGGTYTDLVLYKVKTFFSFDLSILC